MLLLTQHHTLCAMLDQYMCRGIIFNPPIQFGRHHTYNTRYPVHSAAMITQCRLALSKCHFHQKAITRWNSTATVTFHHNLYKYLRCSYVVVVWLLLYVAVVVVIVCCGCTVVVSWCCMCYIVSYICIVCCMCLALLLVLVLYVVTLCTLAWKNGFAGCQSLNK